MRVRWFVTVAAYLLARAVVPRAVYDWRSAVLLVGVGYLVVGSFFVLNPNLVLERGVGYHFARVDAEERPAAVTATRRHAIVAWFTGAVIVVDLLAGLHREPFHWFVAGVFGVLLFRQYVRRMPI